MPTNSLIAVAGPLVRRDARRLAGSAGWGVAGVALDLARPWPLAVAVDDAIDGSGRFGLGRTPLLVLAAVTLVLVTALSGLAQMRSEVGAEQAAERLGAALRHRLFGSLMTLSLRWHDRMRSGEVLSRLTTDVGRVLDAVVAVVTTLLADSVLLVGVLTLLLVVDPGLAAVGLAVLPLFGLLAVRQRRRVRSAQDGARTAAGRFSGTAVDLLRNVRAVQAFGRTSQASLVLERRNADLCRANTHAVTTEGRWAPLADVVLALGSGAVLVVGGHEVIAGRLTVGQLLVVTSYLAMLYSPVRGLSRLSGVLAKSEASAGRILEILRSVERVPAPAPAPASAPVGVTRELGLHDVGFGYDGGRPVLEHFYLTVRAGELVCLMGDSGSGKTTVLNLLLRLYDVDAGAVRFDGVDVRDLDPAGLHRAVALVPQDPWLLDVSIAENIAFGTEHATRHAIVRAARDALVTDFADDLPHGLDTVVGEGGATLSGGQRRRIALARALVADADVLLLDEPTASLDRDSARHVVRALRRAAAGRTVLVVTHDPQLADAADRVVRMHSVQMDGVQPDGLVAVPAATTTDGREEVTS